MILTSNQLIYSHIKTFSNLLGYIFQIRDLYEQGISVFTY